MKVYEITIHVASAYADIGDLMTSDDLAEAIGDFIVAHCNDAVNGKRDIAVEVQPVDPKLVYDSDGMEEADDDARRREMANEDVGR